MEEAKKIELGDGQSIAEELGLIEGQIEAIMKKRDERRQDLIKSKYSKEAEHLNMGEFELCRILNNDAEIRKVWLLGKFKRDPTDNQVIMILNKTEFDEDSIRELFAERDPKNRSK